MGALVVAVIAVAGVVAIVAWYNAEDRKIRRALSRAPLTTVGELANSGGEGKIAGTLHYLGEPLRAPLTGRECAYFDVLVEQYRSSGNSGRWVQLFRERGGQPFVLDDGSGRAIVDPAGARVAVVLDTHTRSGSFDDANAAEDQLLARHGFESKGWVFNKRLRYREGVLEAGETVACLGRGVAEPDPEARASAGYREPPAMRLRLGGSSQFPLLISDHLDALGRRG